MAGEEKLKLVLRAVDRTAAPIRKVNNRIEAMGKPVRKLRNRLRALSRESGLPGLAKAFGRVGRVASRFALAGGAALAGVGVAVERVSAKADELGKFARQIGFGVEALQEFEFAAERSGVSSETFRSSVGALSKRVGELQAGKGALATLLGDSNLAKELKATKNTEQALELVTAAIARVEDPTKKAALAAAAFSRAGLPMIRLANEGAEGIKALRNEAQGLGFVLSEDATKSAEALQDSLTNLKGATSGIVSQVAVQLFPVVQKISDAITGWVATNKELIQVRVTSALKSIIAAGRSLYDTLSRILPPTLAFVEKMGGFRTIAIILGGLLAATVVPAVLALGAAFASTAGLVTLLVAATAAAASAIAANWDEIKMAVARSIEAIVTQARALWERLPAPIRSMLGAVGGAVATVASYTPAGLAAQAAQDYVAGPSSSSAEVGGRISIELDDRRARVKSAETTAPGLELDLAGGEAIAPA